MTNQEQAEDGRKVEVRDTRMPLFAQQNSFETDLAISGQLSWFSSLSIHMSFGQDKDRSLFEPCMTKRISECTRNRSPQVWIRWGEGHELGSILPCKSLSGGSIPTTRDNESLRPNRLSLHNGLESTPCPDEHENHKVDESRKILASTAPCCCVDCSSEPPARRLSLSLDCGLFVPCLHSRIKDPRNKGRARSPQQP